jgi:AraC-like DNA-binding protein
VPARRNASGATSTEAGVLRPEDFARHAQLERHEVAGDLAPWVENHWGLRWELPPGTSYVSSTLPHPACHLGVERGHLRHGIGDDPVVVTGVPTRRWDVEIRDEGWVQSVKFRPGGLTSLTGYPARDLRDVTVPASTVFPAATTDALSALGPEVANEDCRVAFEDALRSLRAEPEPDYLTVLEVITAMLEDRALVRVAQVEDRCGIGTRTLQRLFERYVGVSPKWVLSRYRMHDVVTRLDEGYDGPLADLAAEHGWFDQAHFTREFTELIGVPPTGYVAGAAPQR